MIRTRFYSLIRSIVREWNKYFGFTVTARYPDGTVFVHYCYSWNEALEWMRCYPQECRVAVSQYCDMRATCVRRGA